MKKSILIAAISALCTNFISAQSLVVYFSRADENYGVGTVKEGNTAIIAKIIAEKTNADITEIVPEVAYPKNYRQTTDVAKKEQQQNARPKYKLSKDVDFSKYDTIYIGYPNWWGDMPMVVYSFLEEHDLNGKTIVPFCTHAGSGLSGTVSRIQNIYKNATVTKGLAIAGTTAQNNRSQAESEVDKFLAGLK